MDHDRWQSAILDDPAEPLHLLGYADWLDENGGPGTHNTQLAFALRWMARRKRHPLERLKYASTGRAVRPEFRWAWWRRGSLPQETAVIQSGSCELPPVLLAVMAEHPDIDHLFFPSWEDAVTRLADALRRLREVLE